MIHATLAWSDSPPRATIQKLSAKPTRWVYLGRDYLKLLQWENQLPGIKREPISLRLQEIAAEWRRPYLQWIAALGEKHDSLAWWTSRIAERNTLLDSLFHKVVYLRIARELLATDEPLLIVAESVGVLDTLQGEAPEKIGWAVPPRRDQTKLFNAGRVFAKWSKFWFNAANGWWSARTTRGTTSRLPEATSIPLMLIHLCIDDSFFAAGRDRYLTVLPDELEKRGRHIVVLPWLFQVSRSRRQTIRYFRSHPNRFIVPEDFYRFGDYRWAMEQARSQRILPSGPQTFADHNVTRLVAEARREQALDLAPAYFLLYYRLMQRLVEAGLKVDTYVDTFENMISEKAQVAGLKKFSPHTRTIGYQHWASPTSQLLCCFTTKEEAKRSPLPDTIVCYSPFVEELFAREGYPREKLCVGPSVRYLHLFAGESVTEQPKSVLVLLSMDVGTSAEMMHKVREAFAGRTEITLWIKPHPMTTDREWDSIIAGAPLPSHFKRVSGRMDEWLPKAACTVVGTSTVSIEIALAGKPLVQLGRETDFDFNVLEWFPEFAPPVRNSDELQTEVLSKLNLSPEGRELLRATAKKLASRCLSPINDQTMAPFLSADKRPPEPRERVSGETAEIPATT